MQAEDFPTSGDIATKDSAELETTRKVWLRRHDQDSGGIMGLLPLVKGMPMALTDHLDRSPDKNLLRGKIGTLVGWFFDEEDERETYGAEVILK